MKDITGYISITFLIIASIGTAFGLNLRKWWSWLFVISGFLFGFMFTFTAEDFYTGLPTGICFGTFFAICVAFGGWVIRRRGRKIHDELNDRFEK